VISKLCVYIDTYAKLLLVIIDNFDMKYNNNSFKRIHGIDKVYIRSLSQTLRVIIDDEMSEDPEAHLHGAAKITLLILCRYKQRLLQQAWDKWCGNLNKSHDYTSDLLTILSHPINNNMLRTELEIEVMYKWIIQNAYKDPTGIAAMLHSCKRKRVIVSVLQRSRMERILAGDCVLFQNDLPRHEDGHFTILTGSVDVLTFPENSMQLVRLQEFTRRSMWNEANELLKSSQVLATLEAPSGFGELSSLTNTPRHATIRAKKIFDNDEVYVLVIPKLSLLECIESRRSGLTSNQKISETIDYIRLSGLANRASPKDLVDIAQSMTKRTVLKGEVLYCKGEPIKCLYLLVSGEVVLDTGASIADKGYSPFLDINYDNCYLFNGNTILGDEGVSKKSKATFEGTAVVISDVAIIFELTGFAFNYLSSRVDVLRYCALAYRDLSRWSPPLVNAEKINIYSTFNALRKRVALIHPQRGASEKQIIEIDKTFSKISKSYNNATKNVKFKPLDIPRPNGSGFGDDFKPYVDISMTRSKTQSDKLLIKKKDKSDMKTLIHSDSVTDSQGSNNFGLICEYDISTNRFRRSVNRSALRHAEDAAKFARKQIDAQKRVFAQESILYGELQTSDSSKLDEEIEKNHNKLEAKLQQAINNHRRQLIETIDVPKVALTETTTSIHFLSDYTAKTIERSGGIPSRGSEKLADIDEEINVEISENKSLESYSILTLASQMSIIPKIHQYFYWLDRLNQNSQPKSANRLTRVTVVSRKPDDRNNVTDLSIRKSFNQIGPFFRRIDPPMNMRRIISFTETKDKIINSDIDSYREPAFILKETISSRLRHDSNTKSFNEVSHIENPDEFIQMIQTVDFPMMRSHVSEFLWVTRFIRLTGKNSSNDFEDTSLYKLMVKILKKHNIIIQEILSNTRKQPIMSITLPSAINSDPNEINTTTSNLPEEDDQIKPKIVHLFSPVNEDKVSSGVSMEIQTDSPMNLSPKSIRKVTNASNLSPNMTLSIPTNSSENSMNKTSRSDLTTHRTPYTNRRREKTQTISDKLRLPKGELAIVDPNSKALDEYKELISTEKSSCKLMDGKLKAKESSRFKLLLNNDDELDTRNKLDISMSFEEPSSASLTVNKSVSANSINESVDSTTLTDYRSSRRSIASKINMKDLHSERIAKLEKEKSQLFEWQSYTLSKIINHLSEPRMTLPILSSTSSYTVGDNDLVVKQPYTVKGKRSQRYGNGQIAWIDGRSVDKLAKPPSYLDVYKLHYKQKRGGRVALL